MRNLKALTPNKGKPQALSQAAPATDLKQARRELRRQRRALSYPQQQQAAEQLTTWLTSLDLFRYARRIAFYLTSDGEIDPSPARAIAEAAGKRCYLPVLHPLKLNRLYFARHQTGQALRRNRYGIAEPALATSALAPAWALDLVLLPLVGFDRNGTRLGMGAGYYDRTLAFRKRSTSCTPRLLGLAHSLQELDNIPRQPWDIPLDGIVTDRETLFF